MKLSKTVQIVSACSLLLGCMEGETGSQFSSSSAGSELSGGFRPNETLEVYSATRMMQRRGRIEQTGDYYNYGPKARDIEIVPVKVPFSKNSDTLLAPKRVSVLGGCNQDRVTDRTTCRLNIMPQAVGVSSKGGLYQTVSASGSILTSCVIGHDFPGRRASIRVDSNPAFSTNSEGCLTGSAASRLDKQLKSGKVLITRRVEWPYDYTRDKEMLIEGSWSAALQLYRWSASAELSTLFSPR